MKAAGGIHTKYALMVESVTVICYAKRHSFATNRSQAREWVLHHISAKQKRTYRKGISSLFGAGDGI